MSHFKHQRSSSHRQTPRGGRSSGLGVRSCTLTPGPGRLQALRLCVLTETMMLVPQSSEDRASPPGRPPEWSWLRQGSPDSTMATCSSGDSPWARALTAPRWYTNVSGETIPERFQSCLWVQWFTNAFLSKPRHCPQTVLFPEFVLPRLSL